MADWSTTAPAALSPHLFACVISVLFAAAALSPYLSPQKEGGDGSFATTLAHLVLRAKERSQTAVSTPTEVSPGLFACAFKAPWYLESGVN